MKHETAFALSYFSQSLLRSGGPKWTRFPARKPRRLQHATGMLSRAAFRAILFVHLTALSFKTSLLFDFGRSGGPKWTRTIDLTIISRVL